MTCAPLALAYVAGFMSPNTDCHEDFATIQDWVATHARGFDDEQVRAIAAAIHSSATDHGLPPSLVVAVIRVESSFKVGGKSQVGALGLMQVMPSTGKWFARRAGVRWRGPQTLMDPWANIRIGTSYLAWLVKRFDGNLDVALAAYCHGPTRVRRMLVHSGELDAYRLGYPTKVLTRWRPVTPPAIGPSASLAPSRPHSDAPLVLLTAVALDA